MAVSISGKAGSDGAGSASAAGGQRGGFTLVELLVVLGIMTVLAAILIPVVAAVRRSAQGADTASLIQSLSMAIEMYEKNFHAYPGPLDDQQMWNSGRWPAGVTASPSPNRPVPPMITMSENLFLGLVGGLKPDTSSSPNSNGVFDAGQASTNPRIGDMTNSTRSFEPIFRDWAADASSGAFSDGAGNWASDTNIPEFLDRFSGHRLPILYLRARQGASGVMSGPTMAGPNGVPVLYQYDLRQIRSYTVPRIGLPADPGAMHGLVRLGNLGDPLRSPDSTAGSFAERYGVNDALPYFRAPTTPSSGTNETGSPRMKDKFILISAGPDGIYGTADDITNFGSVSY